MFLTGFAPLKAKLLGGFKVLEVKPHIFFFFFQVEMDLNRALLLCFLHFMAWLCAGMKSITSITALALPFCRTQAIVGGSSCTAASLDLRWAGGARVLAAAGGITVSSQFPAAPWADATVRKSVHAASHEMYQVLHVARETFSFRHSPKCAFCSVCSVPL